MLNFVVLGPPGVGAFGQAASIAASFGLEEIRIMDVILENVRAETPLGTQFMDCLQNGKLPSGELLIALVTDRLAKVDGNWVLTGFPRTVAHAELLSAAGYEPDEVIDLWPGREGPFVDFYRMRGKYQTLPGGYTA